MNGPIDFANFVPPKFVPPDAETHKDLQYSSQGHIRQRLDLYIPKPEARRPGPIPLIVYIHGVYYYELLHALGLTISNCC